MQRDTHPDRNWRPPIGTFIRGADTDGVAEVVAHFESDGYGECLVVRRLVDGRPVMSVLTRAEWNGGGFAIVG